LSILPYNYTTGDKSSDNGATIAGVTVAAVLTIAIVIAAVTVGIIFYHRYRKNKQSPLCTTDITGTFAIENVLTYIPFSYKKL